MQKKIILILIIYFLMSLFSVVMFALNPFIADVYTADPSAHVFENRVYVYPSHDKNNTNSFDMEDYHVFSSADLINWVDHGMILHKNNVPWVADSFWAPDCAYKNGKYYFYFPAKDKTGKFRIGVAIGKSPAGPFVPLDNYIYGSSTIDPCIFVDDDGQAYMFFGGQMDGQLPSGQGPLWAKLNPNMIEFECDNDGNPIIHQIPYDQVQYYFEAPWIHKRNGIYYLSYSVGLNIDQTDHLSEIHYATSNNIAGPWTHKGVVIDRNTGEPGTQTVGWTIHQSFVEYKGDWYAFYHGTDVSKGITTRRSICMDKLNYNGDGTMKIVYKTRVGPVGTSAYSKIKAQLFSGKNGSELKTDNIQGGDIGQYVGWIKDGYSIHFDNVDFGSIAATGFEAEVASASDGCIIDKERL